MYDAVVASNVPTGGDLYAGYDDGRYMDADALRARFPGTPVLAVTVFPWDNEGDVLDVERGDANPVDLPGWLTRRRATGPGPFWGYCSADTWPACIQACQTARVAEPLWWIAHYDNDPTIPAGATAKQYQSTAGYDLSSVVDYIAGLDPPPTPVAPPSYTVEVAMLLTKTLVTVQLDANGCGWDVLDGRDAAHPKIPFDQMFGVSTNGSDPTGPGGYLRTFPPVANDRDGDTQVSAYGAPYGRVGVWVMWAS